MDGPLAKKDTKRSRPRSKVSVERLTLALVTASQLCMCVTEFNQSLACLHTAPIEQNVNGQNGFFQLEYVRKPSKMLQDFKKKSGDRTACEGGEVQVETQVS